MSSVQCSECGANLSKASYRLHVNTEKCQRMKLLNQKCRYTCRACGEVMEKVWHADMHRCSNTMLLSATLPSLPTVLPTPLPSSSPTVVEVPGDNTQVSAIVSSRIEQKLDELLSHLKRDRGWSPPEKRHTLSSTSDLSGRNLFSFAASGIDTDEEKKCAEGSTVPTVSTTAVTSEVSKGGSNDVSVVSVKPSLSPPLNSLPPIHVPPLSQVDTPQTTDYIKIRTEDLKGIFFQSLETLTSTLIDYLLKGEIMTADEENRYYLLGDRVSAFVYTEYDRQPEHRMALLFQRLAAVVPLIRGSRVHYESFKNGVDDSICDHNRRLYIFFSLHIFDNRDDQFYAADLLGLKGLITQVEPLSLADICASYNLVEAMLPIKEFINLYILNIGSSPRYLCQNGQYYRQDSSEASGWVLDPWMLDLTELLVQTIMEKCVALFKSAYKYAYGNNVYRANWKTHAFLKQFIPVYVNVEMAATVFNLNHILRNSIPENVLGGIPEQRPPPERTDLFQLMSTRIHHGIPGSDVIEFFDVLFEDGDSASTLMVSWMEKYLSSLKQYKDQYKPSSRFVQQVTREMNAYRTLR